MYYLSLKSPRIFWGDFLSYFLLLLSIFLFLLPRTFDENQKVLSYSLGFWRSPWVSLSVIMIYFWILSRFWWFFVSFLVTHWWFFFSYNYRNEICFWKNCSNTELMKKKSNPKLWKQNGLNCHYWKAKSKKYLPC